MGKKKITNAHVSLLKGTDADPYTAGPRYFSEEDDEQPLKTEKLHITATIRAVSFFKFILFPPHFPVV